MWAKFKLLLSQSKLQLDVFIRGGFACCLIWGFMICQFWWGNHDWKFLQQRIFWDDGLFEARYSQHLFSILLFEGQILPILTYIVALFGVALLAVLLAKYLGVREDKTSYWMFLLLIVAAPYASLLLYYRFIMLPFVLYAVLGISLLFLSEPPFSIQKFLAGFIGYVFLLGSYPPLLALLFTAFVGRQLIYYIKEQVSLKDVFLSGLFLSVQFLCAVAVFHVIWGYLEQNGLLNAEMYNLQIRDWGNMAQQIFQELAAPVTNVISFSHLLGVPYAVFYGSVLIAAIIKFFYVSKNKWIVLEGGVALFLVSRFPFLISDNAYSAEFRVAYWGQLGLLAVAICFLLDTKSCWQRNIFFVVACFFLFLFIRADYELQKVQYLMFRSERLYHKRLAETITEHPDFDINEQYLTLNLGYPDFKNHFCLQGCRWFNNQLLDISVFPADLSSLLFWDDVKVPVQGSFGVWENKFWMVNTSGHMVLKTDTIDEDVNQIRWWMYNDAKVYPAADSLYLNGGYLIMILNETMFHRNKELVCDGLLDLKNKGH